MSTDTRFTEAIGVDVGSKRIGIARINAVAKLAQPIATIKMDELAASTIKQLANQENADVVVVGVPHTQSGTDSEQTRYSKQFADTLRLHGLQVVEQDETLSTVTAQQRLSDGQYAASNQNQPVGIDEVAACIILENFIQNNH